MKTILLALLLLPIVALPASAYMDPGSGSVYLQLLLGGAAGIAVAVKMFYSKIKSYFSR